MSYRWYDVTVITSINLDCAESVMIYIIIVALEWRHNGLDNVSNHQPHNCLLNSLFKRRSKKTSKLRVTGLCEGNSAGTGEFPAQMASNAENVSICWRHHGITTSLENGYKDTQNIFPLSIIIG